MTNVNLIKGDAFNKLDELEPNSFDLIFADPPYNLSGKGFVTCKNGKPVTCNKGEWDQIEDIHEFNRKWVEKCVRVLKDSGTIWISGTLHNHPSIGVVLKQLGLWIINDIVWFKPNATPLLQTNRLAPSTEIIWLASKTKKYYFNYALGKQINEGKQMRNLWTLSAERHKTKHPTEKPEKLMERIILLGSKEGDNVLDPFMGSGTTGAVAKRLGRNFTGLEIDDEFFKIAKARINQGQIGYKNDPAESKQTEFVLNEKRKLKCGKIRVAV
ncbi:MAG: site-specific DNA-methyltransferase [Candidatus Goldbacteria bacterium]|nr:site-specific DNA-methyltransferase [Candidatus Goldiibacteriota bacterium]